MLLFHRRHPPTYPLGQPSEGAFFLPKNKPPKKDGVGHKIGHFRGKIRKSMEKYGNGKRRKTAKKNRRKPYNVKVFGGFR